jgi:calcium-dependent protein kinase
VRETPNETKKRLSKTLVDPDISAMHDACRQGNTSAVESFLQRKVDVNGRDTAQMTALHYAAHRGHGDLVALLISNQADPHAQNREGMQPMHHAAVGGYKFVVEFLVDRVDCNVFAKDKNGMTVLHHASYHNMFDCVMFAFERGIDLDTQDGGKWTALMYAAQQGHIQMCALLLDLGADLLKQNNVNKTAELIAEAYSMHDCRMVLQKAEAESQAQSALKQKEGKGPAEGDRRGTAIAFMKRRPSATGALLEDYDMEDMVGRGRTGPVYRVRHKITGTTRVLRTIPANKYKDDTGLQQQINVMKAADHPNLVKLYGTYSEGGKVHIILQFCAGGSVMDRIRKDGQFGEATAAKYFKQMLRSAQYMHNQDVIHRDLKLENFLFLSKEPDAPLKVSDFGLASREGEGERFAGGNVAYMAPEMFTRSPDRASDMWMLGVCLYMLVCGKLPFEAESTAKMVPLIRKAEWSFKEEIWAAVSSDCKQLVSGLLKKNPAERFSADQALAHAWFTQQTRRTMVDDQQQPMLQALKSNLERFAMQQKLEKAVLAIAVRNQDESQLKGLRQIFSALDTDQDGVLSVEEVERGLELSEVDIDPEMEAELEHILSVTGRVTYSDFMAMMMDRAIMCEESVVKEAFSIFDRNRDGRLDIEELSAVLKEDAGDLVRDYGDGNTLNMAQFRNLLTVMAAGKN